MAAVNREYGNNGIFALWDSEKQDIWHNKDACEQAIKLLTAKKENLDQILQDLKAQWHWCSQQ